MRYGGGQDRLGRYGIMVDEWGVDGDDSKGLCWAMKDGSRVRNGRRQLPHTNSAQDSKEMPLVTVTDPRTSHLVASRFLTVMQKHGYIDEFEEIDDHRSGKLVIQLNGRVNKCGVISPRFNIQLSQIEQWVALLLPARSFGYLILTTSSGIMDHEEARRKVRI